MISYLSGKIIYKGERSIILLVSGLGKKGAERIIIELKNKISIKPGDNYTSVETGDDDVVEALISLGYNLSDSRQIVSFLSPEIKGVDNRIKEAIKSLGKA